ncbi:hypothetical protein RSal33209_3216 [Renibacterium salmoninarum ATCC 33209]|uniref:Uncharacterized protein n=1 Tax=Renibacterium salmoninarum (strain ATCC 33209 / DSM 20767 / JCM 11484 / NBRC 15589 / NCIMB 2235) TaxID=288705 RepID=A9WUR2_RENSM|nr:hypothetical protein RSal33209_3216 [Renibacterium salmoninarum ATCC 33209]
MDGAAEICAAPSNIGGKITGVPFCSEGTFGL